MERFVGKVVFSEVLASVLVFFWDALIVWMVCGVLLPVAYRHIGRLFKALWGKG